jgi:hypothetical protein
MGIAFYTESVLIRFLSWVTSAATASAFDCEKFQRRQARLDHYGRFTTVTA